MKNRRRSLTLIELLVVVAIVGVGIGLFYSILFTNWLFYNSEISRLDLQEDSESVFMALEEDIMEAGKLKLFSAGVPLSTITLLYISRPEITYTIANDGQLIRSVGGQSVVLTRRLEPGTSFFQTDFQNSVICNLIFLDRPLGKAVRFQARKEINLRNQI